MILVSNWPALPTNGSPCSSSSAPGASPTNMSCASMLPTPNTTFLRDDARCGHFTQASARSRKAANAAALACGSSGGFWLGTVSPGNASKDACSAAGGTRLAWRIAAFGRRRAAGSSDLRAGTSGGRAGLRILPAAGCARARRVSGETATWRTPRDFKSSRC